MATAIGLDIGSSAVRAARITHGRRGSTLEQIGQVQLPTGAVRDGEIVEPDIVVNALKQLWRTFRLRSRKVALGLANQQVVVRRLDLPYMTETELRASLPLQVDGLIPIPVDQAVLDFCYLGEWTNDEGARLVRILLVAAQRAMVEGLITVVERAKLEPVGIDLNAFAALRSLVPPDLFVDPTAELLVDIGSTVTNLVVHQKGAPHFVRTVLFGGQTIIDALAEHHDSTGQAGERRDTRAGGEGAVTSGGMAATDVARRQSRRLIDEIKGSIDYCTAQRDIPPIERIVLTGGGSQLPELHTQMAEDLQLDITTGSPLRAVGTSKTAISEETLAEAEPFLAVAVGLALAVPS